MTKLNEMKHLLTLAALLVSTLALAQFTPYNPDADNDQFVGAQDLLAFLPLFGEDWDLDSLVIYGASELEVPPSCYYPANELSCSQWNWSLVPDDADVVYWDMPNVGGPAMTLWLPVVPKPMLLFGTRVQSFDVGLNSWYNEDGSAQIPRSFAYGLDNTNQMAILVPFNGQYYWAR